LNDAITQGLILMPIKLEDRPVKSVREEVIDQLIMNYGHGKITMAAFERRLDGAMNADDNESLAELVKDLELKVDQEYVDLKKQEMTRQSSLDDNIGLSSNADIDKVFNVCSSNTRSGQWRVAKEVVMTDVLSGGSLDLTEAVFSHQITKIKVNSILSDTTIYVPENINISVNLFSIIGGIHNQAPSVHNSSAPTLLIEGYSALSSVKIKVKRTLKQRMLRLAEEMKSFLS